MRNLAVIVVLYASTSVTAFAQALQKLGWTEGRNARIDTRWAADDADGYRRYSEKLASIL